MATAAGLFLSRSTAAFICCMACVVSFALTALRIWVNSGPSAARTFLEKIGATFWKPKMFFGSFSTVYADGDPIGELPLTLRVRPRAVRVLVPAA